MIYPSTFQCSSASRKFSICAGRATNCATIHVSVLFSEPKILNCSGWRITAPAIVFQCSSASRKFSMRQVAILRIEQPGFSALQRAENSQYRNITRSDLYGSCFSALQRAENSQFIEVSRSQPPDWKFQCSSASRKFSIGIALRDRPRPRGFSALQRAENSQSTGTLPFPKRPPVSVLFSEPKILNSYPR